MMKKLKTNAKECRILKFVPHQRKLGFRMYKIAMMEPPDVETQLEKLSIWFASVAVESAGIEGLHSPSTIYSYDMNVCGDGKRSKDEQCDDRNLNDGDGCSQNCLAEEKFHCVKENKCIIIRLILVIDHFLVVLPVSSSVCYIYEGDGECEPFEWDGYNKDCNNITASTLHSQYYPASIYAYSTILQKNCSLQFLSCATLTTVRIVSFTYFKNDCYENANLYDSIDRIVMTSYIF
ncbi:unnamed protein product [Brugia timori]|uniref:DUF1540 domain-containing protein n=1 Tax=Brugia timori TaxID=42155 RepID=A0A0R3RCW8_9BILA|nr:unnamed protein product [Brugia timori]